MRLTVYGDFNCPFSALASWRIDRLAEARPDIEVEFRAVEHDKEVPLDGEATRIRRKSGMEREIAEVLDLLTPADGDGFTLRVPETYPNTGSMCRSYATTPTADLRRELFDAVWRDGVTSAALTNDGSARQAEWQAEFDSWDKKIVPSLVLEDGYISRGLGGLKRLADLLSVT